MAALGGCKLMKATFLILPLFLILFTVSAVASSPSWTTFNVTVASDGSGNYKTINEAMAAAPTLSESPFVIHIKEGTYSENVEVPSDKSNIVFIGDGSTTTVVTANRSNGTGFGTMDSGTLNVKADGFVAKYMTFENSATPEQGQAAAVVSRSNLSVFYQCAFVGYQDTLIALDGWQFYRECDIYGSVDFICGGALAVFQKCNLYVNLPDHVFTITAQSKDSLESFSGYSIHNCSITVSPETKKANKTQVKGYLGRPWREHSTVVVMESFLDDILVPAGWSSWGETPLNKLTYGEFNNSGLGANTTGRVGWPSFKVLNHTSEAMPYTVSEFIKGDFWLPRTEVPYDGGLMGK